MKRTRRALLKAAAGGAAAVGVAAVAKLALPAAYNTTFGLGDAVTYAALQGLNRRQPLAREFPKSAIMRNFPALGKMPTESEYLRHQAQQFQNWSLRVEGMVAHPASFSLADLRTMPSRAQVTQHSCEEGWSAIAEWTGVQLSRVLEAAGMQPGARYVFFFTHQDDWWDSVDLLDALHPQTLLAYGMNGGELPAEHGAPVRLRVERQLGYKSLKFVNRILVTDRRSGIQDGTGSSGIAAGYSWYAGI